MNLRRFFCLRVARWFWLLAFGGLGTLAAADPVVLLSLRGLEQGRLGGDLPLFVSVVVEAPEGESAPKITLAPAQGSWREAVQVELRATAPGFEPLVAQRTGGETGEPALTLDAEQTGDGVWLFPSTAIARLAPGDYRVSARLTIAEGPGWRGAVTSESLPVRVEPAGAATPAGKEADERRILLLTNEAMALGDFARAAQLLDAQLAANPEHLEFLKLRAVLCLEGGNLAGANACLNRAWDRVAREGWEHPPRDLVALTQAVTLGAVKPVNGTATMAFPAWSIPPEKVRRPVLPEKPAGTVAASKTASVTPTQAIPADRPVLASTPPQSVPAPATVMPSASKPVAASAELVAAPTKPGAPTAGALVPASESGEEKILADPRAQWASAAAAGSRYASGPGYSPAQATGAPNVPRGSDNSNAWCHSGDSKQLEWLELGFPQPRRATEIRVRQTLNPGTIIKVEAIEPDGTSHVWWEGADTAGRSVSAGTITWFGVRVPATDYVVARVRLTLDLRQRVGWKQIDAVQLVGAEN